MKLTVYTDGGARGNPGIAGCGAVVFDSIHKVVAEKSKPLGVATNNQAEYEGAKLGIRACIELGATEIQLYMDSNLVVQQMKGEFKVKHPNMRVLLLDIQNMVGEWWGKLSVDYVPRAENSHADMLANKAMDSLHK